jgi:alpha-galactosidase
VKRRKFLQLSSASLTCLLISDFIKDEGKKRLKWMQLLAQSSTPLFILAQPDALGNEQKSFIKQSFTDASVKQPLAEPMDWLNNSLPSKWKLDGNIVNFDWR